MKMLFSTSFNCKKNYPARSLFHAQRSGIFLVFTMILFLSISLPGCSKQQYETPAKDGVDSTESQALNSDEQFLASYRENSQSQDKMRGTGNGLSFITLSELLRARAATAKYRDFERAKADSFADINVVVPNMGYHFMKSAIVDAKFEITRPEILVYNKRLNGKFELVAVEYAVPISLSPDKAPEGFTGSADVWERNTDFGLWLQHAWIWQFNPDGVFHDTNPLVQVH